MSRTVSSVGEILSKIESARSSHPGRAVLVAVDGPGGAGKTVIAERIASRVDGAVVIHTDDFGYGWTGGWDSVRFDEHVLKPILGGKPGRYQRYDWTHDALAEWHEVPARITTLIVEGVYVTRPAFVVPWDISVWVDAPRSVRLQRGLRRDGEGSRAQWNRWMDDEDAWIASEHPDERCDFVVDGADDRT